MDDHACVNVFGHGLGPEPADFHQHTTAKQPAATCKKGAVMPVGGMNKDYNALMLAWIQQGALNN